MSRIRMKTLPGYQPSGVVLGTENGELTWVSNQTSRGTNDGYAFIFTETVPSMTWTVNHNLGYNPQYIITDLGGNVIDADVLNVTINQLLVTFSLPTTGQVKCL